MLHRAREGDDMQPGYGLGQRFIVLGQASELAQLVPALGDVRVELR